MLHLNLVCCYIPHDWNGSTLEDLQTFSLWRLTTSLCEGCGIQFMNREGLSELIS